MIIYQMFNKNNFFILDIKYFLQDIYFYFFYLNNETTVQYSWKYKIIKLINQLNDRRKFLLKKYVYTINHKRIAINYFYFSMWTGLSGAMLATMIRLELAHPGSSFFKGDSLKYLQVITAHGLIMVFFVVVPLIFGAFANFLIPYHVGSKDVAYPRLNSIGFWIQPCGYLLVAKVAFFRTQFWNYYDKNVIYESFISKNKFNDLYKYKNSNLGLTENNFLLQKDLFSNFSFKAKLNQNFNNYSNYSGLPFKMTLWKDFINYPETFWIFINRLSSERRKKLFHVKCSNRALTTAGWTFITPFSSNVKLE